MASHTLDYGHAISFSTHSDAVNVDLHLARSFVSDAIIAEYFNVALLTVLIYYAFTSIDKEIRFFWSKLCNPISLLYFTNRYVGLLGGISSIILNSFEQDILSCRAMFWTNCSCNLITVVLIDYILQIRVSALYQQKRLLSITLKALFAIEAGIDLGLLIYDIIFEDISISNIVPTINICTISREPSQRLLIVAWTATLIYGMILLCLALFKAAEYWRISSGFKGFHLVRVLIEDQVLYYGLVIFCSIIQIVDIRIFAAGPFVTVLLSAVGIPTLLSILGSHLLINLKEAIERGANEGTNYRSRTISNIEFAEGSNEEGRNIV